MTLGQFLNSEVYAMFHRGAIFMTCSYDVNGKRTTGKNVTKDLENPYAYSSMCNTYEIDSIESNIYDQSISPVVYIKPILRLFETKELKPAIDPYKDKSVILTYPWKEARTDGYFLQGTSAQRGIPYRTLKEIGVFYHLMPNGFTIYLDDEAIDDSLECELSFNMITRVYESKQFGDNTAFILTSEELEHSYVTCIGSDINDDSVPAVWIRPCDEFYKRYADVKKPATNHKADLEDF